MSLIETNLSIFPNPASGIVYLNIKFKSPEEIIFSVKDLQGKIIHTGKIKDAFELNTSEWNAGIYFVECGNAVKKLSVVK